MGVRLKHLLKVKKLSFKGAIVAILIFGALLLSINKSYKKFQSRRSELTFRRKCSPVKSIGFLKMHKAASSAIQNILFRYGYKNSLTFHLPKAGNYLSREVPFQASSVDGKVFSIFALHTKWNQKQVEAVLPKDAKFFTIVRDPIELFESLFHYVNFPKLTSKTIDEYVKTQKPTEPRVNELFGMNQMAWDLGAPLHQLRNRTFIEGLISEADRNFGLVLGADMMDESLVLLRHFLCWSFEDMVTFKMNARQHEHKSSLSPSTKMMLRDKLMADYMIYHHFRHKFNKMVEKFGEDRMSLELEELRRFRNMTRDRCGLLEENATNLQGANKPFSDKVIGFRTSSNKKNNIDCRMITWSELFNIEFLKRKQTNRS